MPRNIARATIRQCRCLIALSTALTCGLATIAYADVQVEGTPAAVRVTTNQETIADVLSAFAATFNVKYRTAIPLTSVPPTASTTSPVRRSAFFAGPRLDRPTTTTRSLTSVA